MAHQHNELPYFRIGRAFGGWPEWFPDLMMRLGGCAAVTACDCCIYFDKYKGTRLYPFDPAHLTRKEYIRFGMQMKPYLSPRRTGIDTLDIYMDGFGRFLEEHGAAVTMQPFPGTRPAARAAQAILRQIDAGWPIPCLTLKHRDRSMKDYEWHWYLLTGYEVFGETCMVKAVTYGSWLWLDLELLWNTGYARRGGLILFDRPQTTT